VASGFVNRLLGRGRRPSAELEAALADLAALAKERPSLDGAATVLGEILPVLFDGSVREQAPVLDPERAAAKLAGGVPLLRGDTIALDVRGFRRRWQGVCAALRRERGGGGRKLADAIGSGRLSGQELLQHVLAGRPQAVLIQADALGLDPSLTAIVLRLALMPVLTAVRIALAAVASRSTWTRGSCRTCGSWPLLAELRGLDQARWLRCGLCTASWEVPRLLCPFCESRDHRVLGFVHVEGEEATRRATTCDVCRGYVKAVATLAELSPPRLLVADLATVDLDLIAAERGYASPSSSEPET
jgi:FdhE protein